MADEPIPAVWAHLAVMLHRRSAMDIGSRSVRIRLEVGPRILWRLQSHIRQIIAEPDSMCPEAGSVLGLLAGVLCR
jgi:hypothetical protein